MIPLGTLLRAQRGVDALVFHAVVRHLVRLAVFHPLVREAKTLRMKAPHPRRILMQQHRNLVDHRLPRRAVVHVFHLFKQLVERRIGIVGLVLAIRFGRAVRTIE